MHYLPEYILYKSKGLISSILTIYIVYDDSYQAKVMLQLENQTEASVNICDNLEPLKIYTLPSFNKHWGWIDDSKMPFIHTPYINNDIFKANKEYNLQVELQDQINQKHIICYFVFNEHNSLFGNAKNIYLTEENKILIGNFVYNSLSSILITYYEQVNEKQTILTHIKQNEQKLQSLYNQAKKHQQIHDDYIIQFCELTLDDYSKQTNKKIRLSEATIEYILTQNIKLNHLRNIIYKSAQLLTTIYAVNSNHQITIEPWHLDFNENITDINTDNKPSESIINSRTKDTIHLLDRLEEACKKVKERNDRLTGTNVGMACDKPISAPAITDALQKHSSRIIKLLNLYPTQWKILRMEFRPLQNILDRTTDQQATG